MGRKGMGVDEKYRVKIKKGEWNSKKRRMKREEDGLRRVQYTE